MIQVFITIVWLAFSPPKAIHVFKPTRDDNHLVCAASIDNGYFIAFLYPICLIGKFVSLPIYYTNHY
jgi:hypothetical protein